MPSHDHRAVRSLPELARARAQAHPDRTAYIYLHEGEEEQAKLTYGQLDQRARAIAANLQDRGLSGERVLMLYPPGLEFVEAFWGCLYAGAVPVPAYPPHPARLEKTLPRLEGIVQDSGAAAVFSTAGICDFAEALAQMSPGLAAIKWLPSEKTPSDAAASYRAHDPKPEAVAFLQYTSGSTGTPKGVMVTHSNLLENERFIEGAMRHDGPDQVVVGWLPVYHDMGLIGNVLQPFFRGGLSVLMSPIAFLMRPGRWLMAITKYRSTCTGGPNFAYDLCVKKVPESVRAKLDLSSWKVAYNGAEPIRPETLERFCAAFSPCGFRREAIFPCYGLAEATLFVTGHGPRQPVVLRADRAALLDGRYVPSTASDAVPLVGCGRTPPQSEVAAVDPQSERRLADGQIGEVWVKNACVAGGYWKKPQDSEATFLAHCVGEDGARQGPFLRTGDLGFLLNGELFVTGRRKDLIIVGGQNHYPQDLEYTVALAVPELRAGCIAAFSIEQDSQEVVVVAGELDKGARGKGPAELEELAQRVRAAIAQTHEIQVYRVVFLESGGIPKTSSGKLQRFEVRKGFLASTLPAVAVL